MKEIHIIYTSFKESLSLYKKIDFKGKFIIPLLILITLFILHFIIGNFLGNLIISFLKLPIEQGLIINKSVKLITKLLSSIIYFFTYKYLFLTFSSPFLGYYSEKVETYYQGLIFNFSIFENFKFFLRGIVISSLTFAIELLTISAFVILGFFLPLKGVFYLLSFITQCFFIGYSFSDFYFERKRFGIRQSLNEAFRNFLAITIIGISFILLFAIPIIGVFYVPFYCTSVATLYFLKKEKIN